MKRTDLPPALQKLVTQVAYVTIATVCPNGRPWNTPVFGCFDKRLNLYWASASESQHSQNIRCNSSVFTVLYDTQALNKEAQGLYLEMTAEMLVQKVDVLAARRIYTSLFGEDGSHEPFTATCERRLYKATPLKLWYNDAGKRNNQFIDVRIPIVA